MKADPIARHTVAVLVDNEPGVLARVIGLFSGRGYNIESLTVAEVNAQSHVSRITVVTTGTPMIIEQIKAQLSRLVPVHRVHDLTAEGQPIEFFTIIPQPDPNLGPKDPDIDQICDQRCPGRT